MGTNDGLKVGFTVGFKVGLSDAWVGEHDGFSEGDLDSAIVGLTDG